MFSNCHNLLFGQAFSDMEKEEGFSDVELVENPNSAYPIFIDTTSAYNYVSTIVLLLAFVILHVYSVTRVPAMLSNKSEFFDLSQYKKDYVDIDLSLSQILQNHKFINIDFVIESDGVADKDYTYNLDSTIMFCLDSIKTLDKGIKITSKILKGQKYSEKTELLHTAVNDYSSIKIQIKINGQIVKLNGITFYWSFFNPNSERYIKSYNILISFLIIYMLAIYLISLKFNIQTFHQIFLLIIGVSGIFSTNPLGFILQVYSSNHISNYLLMAVFSCLLRMYMLILVIKFKNGVPSTPILIITSFAFALYAAIKTDASYNRSLLENNQGNDLTLLPSEKLLSLIDLIYSITLTIFIVISYINRDISNTRRIIFYSITSVILILSTCFTDFYYLFANIFKFNGIQKVLENSIHVSCASFLLFMFHQSDEKEYQEFNDNKNDEPMVLDIEQMESDNGKSESTKDEEE